MLDLRRVWPSLSIAAAALALCLVSLALAARADAYIYWTNYSSGTIGRANLDGSGVNQSFITVAGTAKPNYGIAVNDKHIFWASGAGSIGRANLDGTGVDPNFIPTAPGGGDAEVELGGGKIFWANTPSLGWIGSANLDGTAIDQQLLAPQSDSVRGLAVDDRFIYWSDYQNSRIGSGELSTLGVDPLFINPTAGRPEGLAVDDAHVYWSNGSHDTIGRANLDGSGVDQDFIPTAYAYGVEVNDSHIFWANYDTNSIGRATLSGAGADPSFIIGADGPEGVAVDALPLPPDTDPPETTIIKGAPNRTDKHKVKFKFSSDEPSATFECKLDKKAFKACTSPRKVKRLDEGKHKFKVRAIDAAGNVDSTPAKDKFKVVE